MRKYLGMVGIMIAAVLLWGAEASAKNAEAEFRKFCHETYEKSDKCPKDICQLRCADGKDQSGCVKACSPKKCPAISAGKCPKDYCAVMTDCSKQKICHYQMFGEPARCGNLAYAGQDVACCEGLTKRCGVEFFDGTCDMEGKNSIYNLSICIPCGDGVCGNFENRCNCPEDCKNPMLDGDKKPGKKDVKKEEKDAAPTPALPKAKKP